jgi:hypothetical protein
MVTLDRCEPRRTRRKGLPGNLRILENRDVEFRGFLSLIIEPQERSDFLHIVSVSLPLAINHQPPTINMEPPRKRALASCP